MGNNSHAEVFVLLNRYPNSQSNRFRLRDSAHFVIAPVYAIYIFLFCSTVRHYIRAKLTEEEIEMHEQTEYRYKNVRFDDR